MGNHNLIKSEIATCLPFSCFDYIFRRSQIENFKLEHIKQVDSKLIFKYLLLALLSAPRLPPAIVAERRRVLSNLSITLFSRGEGAVEPSDFNNCFDF